MMKVLYFDRSGWCVWAKRLESGRFISDWSRARTHEIDCTRLKLLLEGIEPARWRKRYRHEAPGEHNDNSARVRNSDLYGSERVHGGLA
jgi:hypothetical protein